jgi:hypothetical protein
LALACWVPHILDFGVTRALDRSFPKGNIKRTKNPDEIPFIYGEDYKKNKFFPGDLVSLREPYMLRDHRGQTIITYPFQYNPVTKTLRVYSEITVEVKAKINESLKETAREKELAKAMNLIMFMPIIF